MTAEEFEIWLDQPSPRRCLLVGVLNVTPDSFSDGGQFLSAEAALRHANQMLADGADMIDIGGESTRPGSDPVGVEEQLRRVLPVIRAIRSSGALISIDTTSAEVAEVAMKAGAHLVNDVSGATDDEQMPAVMAGAMAAVLMHRPGPASSMQRQADYDDVVSEVGDFLQFQSACVENAGLESRRIFLDPGIGFGKTLRQNLLLLRDLEKLRVDDQSLYVGSSRKRFIGAITGEPEAKNRIIGTAATVAWSVAHGAEAVRVHDIRAMRQTIDMIEAIREPQKLSEDPLR